MPGTARCAHRRISAACPRMSTSIQLGPMPTLAPASMSLAVTASRCSGAVFLMRTKPRGDGAGHQIGAAFDAIGQHFVAGGAQLLDALDDDLVGARALDLRAHGDQEIGEVDDLRFARGVFDDGFAIGQRRGHHEILGAGDGDGFEVEPRALEPPGARADVAAFDVDVRAHGLQPRDMDVHRPRADGAAAGQRHIGLAEARQQRSQHQDRRAHGLHQLVRRETFARGGGVDLDLHLLVDGDRDAHAP